MLTQGQQNYLSKLSPERAESPITVHPYNPRTEVIATETVSKIRRVIPEAGIRFMGASALKISGQNDVDIYILVSENQKNDYLDKLNRVFGKQTKNKWNWYEGDIEVSVYLSDSSDSKFKEQLDIFDLLVNNSDLLKEYETLKESMSGKSYIEYQTAKYEFYNRVLGIK